METIVCPPQRRSIRIGWYTDDPVHSSSELLKKGLFRLWFPEITFGFAKSENSILYAAFNLPFPCPPFLPNIFDDLRVCQKFSCSCDFEKAIQEFWDSKFWDYNRNNNWRGVKYAFRIFEPEQWWARAGSVPMALDYFKAYQIWEKLSLQEVEQKMVAFAEKEFFSWPFLSPFLSQIRRRHPALHHT